LSSQKVKLLQDEEKLEQVRLEYANLKQNIEEEQSCFWLKKKRRLINLATRSRDPWRLFLKAKRLYWI